MGSPKKFENSAATNWGSSENEIGSSLIATRACEIGMQRTRFGPVFVVGTSLVLSSSTAAGSHLGNPRYITWLPKSEAATRAFGELADMTVEAVSKAKHRR